MSVNVETIFGSRREILTNWAGLAMQQDNH